MNRTETAKILAVLQAAWPNFPVERPDDLVTAYQLGLDDVPYEAANAAVREWIKMGKFFPKPVELRGIILDQLLGLPAPEEAWAEVMRAIRDVGSYGVPTWSCLAIDQAVRALGWRELCCSEEIGVERAHFFRTYAVYRDRELRDANLPALWAGLEDAPRLERGEPIYRRPEDRHAVAMSR